jgi:hypothetical protein
MKIKQYKDWLVENAQIGNTSIDNPGGFTYSPVVSEEELSNYMFFSNLKRSIELAKMILQMDQQKVDELLNNGHDWANDHVTKAKENLSHVFEFLKNEAMVRESLSESKVSDFNRVYTMSPEWWVAWKTENEDKGYTINKDAFSKTYEINLGDKLVFIFDYSRNRVFTNENPEIFTLKDNITTKELEDIEKKADVLLSNKPKPKPEDKKPEGEEGESKDDKEKPKGKDPMAALGMKK